MASAIWSAAEQEYLDRGTPVTELIAAYTTGRLNDEEVTAALAGHTYADVPAPTPEELMGGDGGQWVRDTEPGGPPVPGSWGEVEEAVGLGLLPFHLSQDAITRITHAFTPGGDAA